jgi:peptidoglycan hydrolase-like protein with peptidoglycan-binding domain
MGIFGFLSSAHIEQTSTARENIAKIEQISTNIVRQETIVTKSLVEIEKIETSGSNTNEQVNAQIEKELTRIETVRKNYNSLVDEQQEIINSASGTLDLLKQYIADQNIEALQSLVGAAVDGNYGKNTAKKVEEFREKEESKVSEIVTSSRERINQLRDAERNELTQSNELLDRLRDKLGVNELSETQLTRIQRLENNIIDAEKSIDTLTEERYNLETSYRKLEAEVGPVKYIAEFVYGDADADILESAVRWVIIAIVFVFDPLAILLLIAAQLSFKMRKERKLLEKGTKIEDSVKDAEQVLIKTNTGWQKVSKNKEKRKKQLDESIKE